MFARYGAAMVLSLAMAAAAQDSVTPAPTARIAGGVMAGRILTKVAPIYPPEAKAKHISGIVVLHAVIGKDGTIANLTVVSGPEELRHSALDAVQRWTYKPYLLNGEPTEVDTTITVNYNFGGSPPPPPGSGPDVSPGSSLGAASGPAPAPVQRRLIRVSGGVMNGQILTRVQPVFSPDIKVFGIVVLHATIGADGKVKSLELVSGRPELAPAVIDAVKQWTYRPYLLNGEPIDVDTTITLVTD